MSSHRSIGARFPEIPIALFALLLNFVWEAFQCPFLFVGMGQLAHASGVQMCLQATIGDMNIMLAAFWMTAFASPRRRSWLVQPRSWERGLFIALGVAITIAYELLATRVWGRWAYSDSMPVLFGVGLAPVAQWLVIPPIVLWLARRRAPLAVAASAAVLVLLLPTTARADDGGFEVEKCHLLCTTESGRVATSPRPEDGTGFDAIVELVGISPVGAYAGGQYRPMAKGTEASALQILPSLTWRPRDGVALTIAWPWETNRSRGVVLPSLHPQDASYSETAPGRILAHARVRLPDDGWAARPWVGVGYALSDPIGTDDVREAIDVIPEIGLEALGAGTDDAFVTFELVSPRAGPRRYEIGVEGRLHALPRFERLHGVTAAWHVRGERELGAGWAAELRASGFRTTVVAVGESQSNALILKPAISKSFRRGAKVSAGFSTEVPGTVANENAIRTYGAHLVVGTQF